MPEFAPYRFAVLTYTPMLRQMMVPYMHDPEFTLDFFDISYATPVLGVQKLFDLGFEVILFYSTFGASILQQIGHSIVLIQKTDQDVIKALLRAREVSGHVALSVHDDETIDMGFMENLLDMRIHKIPHSSVQNLRDGVNDAIAKGLKVLVGGGVIAAMAAEHNMPSFIIPPNIGSIKLAIRQAKSVAKVRREERAGAGQLVAILKLFQEGVVCVSQSGEIFFSNDKASELLKINNKQDDKRIFEPFFDVLRISDVLRDGKPRIENVVSIHGEDLVVTTMPVTIHTLRQGVVAFISGVADIHNITGRIRGMQHKSGFAAHFKLEDFKGEAHSVLRLKKTIPLYASHNAALCIQGETGTGKEVLAQALHNSGPRSKQPFVAVNCAALPDSLLESELFGYEEGAFTGARRGGKPGVFEMAHRGTLFLDEIGDIGHNAQLRLLRVLESRELVRVGGNMIIPVDIRVISASHRPLPELVAAGTFRRDLFYRLAVLRLHIPPLRQRLEDIPTILGALLAQYRKDFRDFTPAMRAAINNYSWPGNVRELLAFIESYLILLENGKRDESLFTELLAEWAEQTSVYSESHGEIRHANFYSSGEESLKTQLACARREIAASAVRRCNFNKQAAAVRLGISYNTLWRILSGEPEQG